MSTSTDLAKKVKNSPGTPKPTETISKGKYSLHIDIGWTFSPGKPSGQYTFRFNGKTIKDGNHNQFSDGKIYLDNKLESSTGSGELLITVTNGPTYRARVELGSLPHVATPDGLARRLTNLGFYAGPDTGGKCNARMAWAIRAFKRVKMNSFIRNSKVVENNVVTAEFLNAIRDAYGKQPDDDGKYEQGLKLTVADGSVEYCRMFGDHTYYRGSFEKKGQKDDIDQGPEQNGLWCGVSATCEDNDVEAISGEYTLYLRAFDPDATKVDPKTKQKIKIGSFSNRVNLPQPIHMAQFVLFELGYWLVGGEPTEADWAKVTGKTWVNVSKTETRNKFIPSGKFDRYTQWAVREFQCHAKFPNAAKEDVTSTEKRYLPRLFKLSKNPPKISGDASYLKGGKISGALNEATRKALQAWADGALRCPVIVYSQYTDEEEAKAQAKAKRQGIARNAHETLIRENLWLNNDHKNTASRMYAIDYSGYYTIPSQYQTPPVTWENYSFPKPIVLSYYEKAMDGGPCSLPGRHTWESPEVEVRPDTLIGKGGNNGNGLTDKELSTFKVVRTASHFECYCFFDCINAYDDVTISFGPCHWTAQSCYIYPSKNKEKDKVRGENAAQGSRELPAFLAFMKSTYTDSYQTFFGNFGLLTEKDWPISLSGGVNTYSNTFMMQTEDKDSDGKDKKKYLCGNKDRLAENRYLKNWHWFYRFLMATRTSTDLHYAMWKFTRIRIGAILNQKYEYTTDKVTKTKVIGQYATSEKAVAMLLRWHIRFPGGLFNTLYGIMKYLVVKYPDPKDSDDFNVKQTREEDVISQIFEKSQLLDDSNGKDLFKKQMRELNGWTDVPQSGFKGREYYNLKLTNRTLSSEPNSFKFEELPVPGEENRKPRKLTWDSKKP